MNYEYKNQPDLQEAYLAGYDAAVADRKPAAEVDYWRGYNACQQMLATYDDRYKAGYADGKRDGLAEGKTAIKLMQSKSYRYDV